MDLREHVSALRRLIGGLRWQVRTRFGAVIAVLETRLDTFSKTFLVPLVALLSLTLIALAERTRTRWRRFRGKPPRLIWGPSANLNNKYWSAALRAKGYESATFAHAPVVITARGDFDLYPEELLERNRLSERWHPYVPFVWALRHGDVFLMYFDGGFLRSTPLEWRELSLLRLAGKKLIVVPYGGDIAVPGHLGRIEAPLLADYPDLPKAADLIKRRILYLSRFADVSVRNTQPGFQPWFNVLWGKQLGIDTDLWIDQGSGSSADGRDGEVTVVHAPNHRAIKGTAHLERAVEELRNEGVLIKLQILEKRANTEVRAAVAAADIVADQFLLSYALFAIEGMASGKPVLSNMSQVPDWFRDTVQMRACPIVNSSPATVKEDLRRLVADPDLRRELGRAGREFVIRYHSYEPIARRWDAIVQFAWAGRPLPEELAAPATGHQGVASCQWPGERASR
jgi:glycosyltransferase involved in cell wall biosynthesis